MGVEEFKFLKFFLILTKIVRFHQEVENEIIIALRNGFHDISVVLFEQLKSYFALRHQKYSCD